jgi:NAD(P)-dependent dehydrogenase (short-subunit alcohol dehydrogenase family)
VQRKVAAITGAANGIGESTAWTLHRDSYTIAVLDIDGGAAEKVAKSLRADGGDAIAVQCDVSDEEMVRSAIQVVAQNFGGIDALINNAAVFIMEDVGASVDAWRKVLDVNVMGSALCVKHVLPHMRGREDASIVNLASISAHVAQPNFLTYNTSKAAILGMTRCLALDLAKDKIRVNAVSPGTTWTSSNEAFCATRGIDRRCADAAPHLGGAHMLNRCAEPHEIASAIAFLCSSKASFITGEILRVDGGYTAQ